MVEVLVKTVEPPSHAATKVKEAVGTGVTVTAWLADPEQPSTVSTVSVTLYVPRSAKEWIGSTSVIGPLPSSMFQFHESMEVDGSTVEASEKKMASP